jgi:adenylate cyclase
VEEVPPGVLPFPAPVAAAPSADRPTLVVLPFANMTGDPEQDYFADGITEDLTTSLTRMRWLSVIARNSAFTYKGRAVDVRQVGRDLGARYVLEGSIRRGGDRLRITGQLVDTATGSQLWADRFDGAASDVFDLQDKVTQNVAGAIEPRLLLTEVERVRQKPVESLAAYDVYLRALWHSHRQSNEGTLAALPLLKTAMRLEPDAGLLWAMAAYCESQRCYQGWTDPPGDPAEATRLARGALARSPTDPDVLWRCGFSMVHCGGDLQQCQPLMEQALLANPNSVQALVHAGWVRIYAGEFDRAAAAFLECMRLSPLDPVSYMFTSGMAASRLFQGDFAGALDWGRQALVKNTSSLTIQRLMATAHVALGQVEEARALIAEALALNPNLRVSLSRASAFRFIPGIDAYYERLRIAGLPE